MASITGVNYDQDKYRTPITTPGDNALHGNVIVTLKEPPVGQPNFTVGAPNNHVVVYRTHGGGIQRMTGNVVRVYGPSKYEIGNLL